MVFRDRAGYSYKVRVVGSDGSSIRASTGTPDKATAEDVERFAKHLHHTKDWRTLDAIIREANLPKGQRQVTLRSAYDANKNGTLKELIESASDVDLDPLVTEWAKQGATARYVTQVRKLIAGGLRFPASDFTRKRLSVFLATLGTSGSTKRRYRTALSQFARWLVEREILETNPVRDVKAAKENPARMVWHTVEQAKALIDALPEPYKAREAIMGGTGMEWESVAKAKRRDVDTETRKIHAKGGKHTDRFVKVTESWTWPIILKHVKDMHPNAPLFEDDHDEALDVHHAACVAAEVPDSTLHDWRHTYAVNWLRRGGSPQVLKKQLGHKPNSIVVERVYGVWIVEDSDYEQPASKPAKRRKA